MMTQNGNGDRAAWPELHVSTWAPTKRRLHLYAQMLGKIRVALSPVQPNWMFTPLHLTARGMTTGFVPYGSASLEARLDVFDSLISIGSSSGRQIDVALASSQTVRDVYEALSAALRTLGVECTISTIPQELPDRTPFTQDETPGEYDPEAVRRWFVAATATAAELDRWRAHFCGRSGVQLWWGAFDVGLVLFNGRRVTPPADRGYIMKYDLDAELMSVGLYLGDERVAPFYYGYIFPEPPGAQSFPIAPSSASWSSDLHEWVLPYESVRAASDPGAAIRAFADSIYGQCFSAAGWAHDACTYDVPSLIRKRALRAD